MLVAIDAAVILCFCLGLGLIITGFVALIKGRTWINKEYDSSPLAIESNKESFFPKIRLRSVRGLASYWKMDRSKKPGAFWATTICLYWGFGLFFLVCSALFVMQNLGYIERP